MHLTNEGSKWRILGVNANLRALFRGKYGFRLSEVMNTVMSFWGGALFCAAHLLRTIPAWKKNCYALVLWSRRMHEYHGDLISRSSYAGLSLIWVGRS